MVKSADTSDPAPDSSADAPADEPAPEEGQRPSTTGVRPLGSTPRDKQRDSVPILPPRPGAMKPERVVGRCEIFSEIAEGDLASVYVGRQIGVGGFARTVAVKVLHEQYAKEAKFREKFLSEAHVVSRIRHPNVVPTLDFIDEGDDLFIVMEYVEGDTLSHLMKGVQSGTTERPPIGVALSIVSATLHGLHAAHEACDAKGEPMDIVHRDVNPHNVLVGTDGYARLLDFGLARALGQSDATKSGKVHGEPGYRAPEQIKSEPIDARTDIFAASVMLWHTLTGKRLFDAENVLDVAKQVLSDPIDPPSKHRDGISPQLDLIVRRGLERDPDKRWPTAEAMAEAIDTLKKSAAPREVGAWVRKRAHGELARRSALIAGLERAPIDKEGMEQKSSLPVYRMPSKDGGETGKAAEAADDAGPLSEPSFDDDDDEAKLDEASFPDDDDEAEQDEKQGEKQDEAKDEPQRDKAAPAPARKPAHDPGRGSDRPDTSRRKLLILGGALVLGVLLALVTLTGDETKPQPDEPPQPTAAPEPGPTVAPTPVSPTTEPVETAKPTPSTPPPTSAATTAPSTSASAAASAAPSASAPAVPTAAASAAPTSQPPPVGTPTTTTTPTPTSTGLYGRE